MIYTFGDGMRLTAMIYQACGLDKIRRDFRLWRIYSRLPLTSELDALCAEYANPRSPVPEQIRHRFLTTFVYFLVLFSLKTMLSDALVRTVST